MSTKEKTNVIFPISGLHIRLDTNIEQREELGEENKEFLLFKRTMIKMPKMDISPVFDSEIPYFTKNVKYPKSLENSDYKAKYEFFFNRRIFVDILRREIDEDDSIFIRPFTDSTSDTNSVTDKEEYDTNIKAIEKENIMITLRCLFPIPEVFGKVLKNSYDDVLGTDTNRRIFSDINVLSTLNIFGFMYKFGILNKEKQEYFINLNGKRYMVDDVTWENDIVSHPIYKRFLTTQQRVYEEVGQNLYTLQKKKKDAEDELKSLLNVDKNTTSDDPKNEKCNKFPGNQLINGKLKVDSTGVTTTKITFTEPIKIDNFIDISSNSIVKLDKTQKDLSLTYFTSILKNIYWLSGSSSDLGKRCKKFAENYSKSDADAKSKSKRKTSETEKERTERQAHLYKRIRRII